MSGIFVSDNVILSSPLSEETVAKARDIRWKWVIVYNRLKAQKGGGADHDAYMAQAVECIGIIDSILAAHERTKQSN